jgi:hypothetical protein
MSHVYYSIYSFLQRQTNQQKIIYLIHNINLMHKPLLIQTLIASSMGGVLPNSMQSILVIPIEKEISITPSGHYYKQKTTF